MPKAAEIKMLWQTPMLHVNIAALIGSKDVKAFNEALARGILSGYQEYLKEKGDRKKNMSPFELWKDYVAWQRAGDWKKSFSKAAVEPKMLENFIKSGAVKLLKSISMPEDIISKSSELEAWSSIHGSFSLTSESLHTDSVLLFVP